MMVLRAGADDVLSKSGASGTCSVRTHRAGSKMYEAESLCAARAPARTSPPAT